MKVLINNKATETMAQNIAELADELKLPEAGVAMATNSQMVPRSDWADTAIEEGANIVIIKAACGG